MRFLYKSWQDRRPRFSRRVRWYTTGCPSEPVLLKFEDANIGEASRSYADAQPDYDAFCQGRLTVEAILHGEQ
jgi:hypothetical protein